MIVLVCGGRTYGYRPEERRDLFAALSEVHASERIDLLVHGAAQGADSLAEEWARGLEVPYLGMPAKWKTLARHVAGPSRNRDMLDTRRAHFPFQIPIDLVIAFPGGSGTEDMKTAARTAGVRVWEPIDTEGACPTTPPA